MIATPTHARRQLPVDWQDRFVTMLPAIQRHLAHRLRTVPKQEREDLISEAIALAFLMFVRLAERGKIELAFASPLAAYGCQQALDGRRLGRSLNMQDVTSRHAQMSKGIRRVQLDRYDPETESWKEILVEDHRATPADLAASRIDVAAWLKSLKPRTRKIAKMLAVGETTKDTAKKFEVSPARISQCRKELRDSWGEFQGELAVA